jgi:sugar phosphate isomerase/epimerase
MAGLAGGLSGSRLLRAAAERPAALPIRIGTCVLGLPEARRAGLAGVEVRVGNAADRLQIADPKDQQKYKEQMKETGLVICSLQMGLLNSYPLASDPRGPAWLEQSIDAAKELGARVILVAFFGKGDLQVDGKLKNADVDVVVKRIKAAAPRAKDAGVILAIENYLTARDNLKILERIDHDSVRLYYDVGNSTKMGADVPAEIRLLKDRIVQFHFKDNPHYLGEGNIQFAPIAAAIKEIGYKGWIVLETTNPSRDGVADGRRNAEFVQKLFGLR